MPDGDRGLPQRSLALRERADVQDGGVHYCAVHPIAYSESVTVTNAEPDAEPYLVAVAYSESDGEPHCYALADA